MNQTILLATAAAVAVVASSESLAANPVHRPSTVLWNQNSNFSYGINSQNYEKTYSAYDDAGADDFVVPKGETWKISEVDVTGVYYNGSGPAASENVTIYADSKGKPGKALFTATDLKCADSTGSFACNLGKKGPKLKGGANGSRYWLSVVANCSFTGGCSEWGWVTNTVVQGKRAVQEQAGGPWKRLNADLTFTLVGKS